ncbi:GPW/gp25 family protein [Chitiniphilus eburneus]|uniref:Type VI secretion system baseplate subunit TssE n=1 Tax=Chitiniphilus eburneus TaxID=2571148 RepID=A0A4V6WI83_9NEIS|nr:GPW/gp25 family protein [Chitiniphilus eburneus]TJZ73368.1 type VI secretion system baseplate subunit TssE [Chitiniphilus eburneus]
MRFLFERLVGEPVLPGGYTEPFDPAAAVAAQIGRLVSTRAWVTGDRVGLLDFGIEHVADLALNSRSQLERYGVRLAQLIAEYEPRLSDVVVNVEPVPHDALHPWRLAVSGILADSGQAHLFHFALPQH